MKMTAKVEAGEAKVNSKRKRKTVKAKKGFFGRRRANDQN